eukprot:GHVQ01041878.1.p1 GENE.GHVQ01041878.1~~GHVQ01041878.1.p1  ORF type:complete len:113 (+),score=14.62 GHVQ01041878.1:104-442(+)
MCSFVVACDRLLLRVVMRACVSSFHVTVFCCELCRCLSDVLREKAQRMLCCSTQHVLRETALLCVLVCVCFFVCVLLCVCVCMCVWVIVWSCVVFAICGVSIPVLSCFAHSA